MIRQSNTNRKEAIVVLNGLDQIARRALTLQEGSQTKVEGERLHEFGRQLTAAWLPKLELDPEQLQRLIAGHEALQKAWPEELFS